MVTRTIGFLFVASCGWLPADSPPQKPAPVDPDAVAIVHTWVIDNHVLGGGTNFTDRDAAVMHGRKVVITANEFKSPWQGSCEDTTREKHERNAAEISMKHDLVGQAWKTVSAFGIGPEATEYQLSCTTRRAHVTPPLTLYITGNRAMTCFAGVCYLMSRS